MSDVKAVSQDQKVYLLSDENLEYQSYIDQLKDFITSEPSFSSAEFGRFGVPRFGPLSLYGRAMPMYAYDHPAIMSEICDTAFTDGQNVFYSVKFLKEIMKDPKSAMNGLAFLALHEICHPFFMHFNRLLGYPAEFVGVPQDMSINTRLLRDFVKDRNANDPCCLNPLPEALAIGIGFKPGDVEKYAHLSEEDIARIMWDDYMKQQQSMQDFLNDLIKQAMQQSQQDSSQQSKPQNGQGVPMPQSGQSQSGEQGDQNNTDGEDQAEGNQASAEGNPGDSDSSETGQQPGQQGDQGQDSNGGQGQQQGQGSAQNQDGNGDSSGSDGGQADASAGQQQGQGQGGAGGQGGTQSDQSQKGDGKPGKTVGMGHMHTITPDQLAQVLRQVGLGSVVEKLELPVDENSNIDPAKAKQVQENSLMRANNAITAMNAIRQKLGDRMPGAHCHDYASEQLGKLAKPKITWKTAVKSMLVGQGMRTTTTFDVPGDDYYIDPSMMNMENRLYIGARVPSKVDDYFVAVLDSSGSMSQENLREAVTEIYGIAQSNRHKAPEVVLMHVDTVIRGKPIVITPANVNALLKDGVKANGRGGTSLLRGIHMAMDSDEVKKRTKKKQKCLGLLYFTDLGDAAPRKADLPKNMPKHVVYFAVSGTYNDSFASQVADYATTVSMGDKMTVDITEEDASIMARGQITRKVKEKVVRSSPRP